MKLRHESFVRASLLALAGAGLSGSLSGCNRNSQAAAAPAMPPPMVQVSAAIAKDIPVYLDEIGKCAAREMVAIKPQVAGKITEIKFTDGADVKKGQVLFSVDARPYKAALDQAKGMLSQSKAQLNLAKIEFNRIKDLPRSVEPQEDFDAKQSAIEVAAASVESSTAAVETAQVNLDYCTIASPIDGRAGQHLVDIGNVINPNIPTGGTGTDSGSALLMIQRLDPIYADFTINEGELLKVRQEMAHGTLKTMVKLSEDKDYREGALTFLDNAVQDGSGTVKLRATMPNPDRHFWPGQFVNIRLVLRVEKDAVLVPTSVPQQSQKGAYALVVTDGAGPDGKPAKIAEMRPVVLGQRHGDMIALEKGVKVGEDVIIEGQMLVRPGGPVTVLPPAHQPEMVSTEPKSTDAATTAPTTTPATTQPDEAARNGGAK